MELASRLPSRVAPLVLKRLSGGFGIRTICIIQKVMLAAVNRIRMPLSARLSPLGCIQENGWRGRRADVGF